MSKVIFVVDDDLETSRMARHSLRDAGYEVSTPSPINVLAEAEKVRPSLIIMASSIRNGNGIATCKLIRQNPILCEVSVILLLCQATAEHRIQALQSGGDYVLVKPITPHELVARVRAILRRPRSFDTSTTDNPLVIDSLALRLSVGGVTVEITPLEFRLIDYLARHRGRVFTREFLLASVWGDNTTLSARSVDVCVKRVRDKIKQQANVRTAYLKTVRGVGYILDAAVEFQSPSQEPCDCPACRGGHSVTDLVKTGKTSNDPSLARSQRSSRTSRIR